MSGHISPIRSYLAIFGALMVGTVVTVGAAMTNLGALNFPVALAIAVTKATLVIAKLDRLARNVHFITGLLESGVNFVCADMPEADRTFLQMAAVFAEWEARKISDRTKAALAAAKARGQVLGSPKLAEAGALGIQSIKARAAAYAERVGPIVRDIIAKSGAKTMRDIAQVLTARCVETPRGGQVWHPSQVSNLLARI